MGFTEAPSRIVRAIPEPQEEVIHIPGSPQYNPEPIPMVPEPVKVPEKIPA